ncbi:MAG TPA: DUF1552 domain-containing protein [Polyangiaceae bacterium]|nr:DUF1552 domain-containing protein [Polyangiaceae bacterium]
MRVSSQQQYPLIADLQIDILALALACDATRVATLQFDRGAGGPTFNWEGIHHEYNHHKISHGKVRDDCFGSDTSNGCDNVDGYLDMLFDIDRWHQSKFARLLGRLSSYVEADGRSVLDNSVVLYTNELSDGRRHSFTNQPYILAGSAAGVFRQGEQIALGDPSDVYSERAPHNRLLNTLLNAFDVPSDWFGTRSGGRTMQGGIYDALLC